MSRPSVVDWEFKRAFAATARPVDLAAIVTVPLALCLLFVLPPVVRDQFVFETATPTAPTAYTAHFVHRQWTHLLGNVAVYLAVAPVTYLLCLLAGRRGLFRVTFLMLFTVFPFILSGFQLLFPRHREILGFSGINAGLFGLLCVAWTIYVGRQFLGTDTQRYAPAVLFVVCGLGAAVTLPARAWRLEIALGSLAVGAGYLGAWLYRSRPTRARIERGFDQFGYAELAGAGLGLLLSYPIVGFGGPAAVSAGIVDVYIHLLGYALTFISVYAYTTVVSKWYPSRTWPPA